MLPGQLGLATFSPRLNKQGNPVHGVEVFQRLSDDMGLHLMSAELLTQHAIRSISEKNGVTTIQLQGAVNFSAAENFLFSITEHDFVGETVVLDISRVPMFRPMGRRMVKEGLRRIRDHGFEVAILDPEDLLPDFTFSDGTVCRQISSLREL